MRFSKKVIAILTIAAMALVIGAVSAGCLPMETAETGEEAEQPEGVGGLLAQYGTWIWLIVLVVAFYFLLIRPQRQRSQKSKDLLSSIIRGDEVVTIGGFYGKVKDVREDTLIVTLSSGVDVKISKSAISKKVGPT
ncbi:MAG: preprotein translocase subunit YajC [Actinomycetota bacterium]